jgi:hypothetical protein
MFLRSSTPERLIQSDLIDFFLPYYYSLGYLAKKNIFSPLGSRAILLLKMDAP